MDIDERFAALAQHFAGRPGVAGPGETGRRGFGSDALTVNGAIFAMVSRGRLVVKLPRRRVEALIESGVGAPFDTGTGRPMKEWLTVVADDDDTCLGLAREAHDFVAPRG